MSRRRKTVYEDETNYWLSYSDMLVSLLLLFALVLVFSTFKSKIDSEQKEAELKSMNELLSEQQEKLESLSDWEEDKIQMLSEKSELESEMFSLSEKLKVAEFELANQNKVISELESEMFSLSEKLKVAESELANQSKVISELESEKAEQESEIENINGKISELESERVTRENIIAQLKSENQEKVATIEELETEIEKQKITMSEQQATMSAQQEQLDKLIGIRSEIIEALRKEFDDTELNVNVDDQTGAITFDSNILFDYNMTFLRDFGKAFLVDFIPRYIMILQDIEFQPYIAEIIIEGHTDTSGSYLFNLELSQKRALEVVKYFLSENENILDEDTIESIRPIITANGRSYSNPIVNDDGSVNMDASRRVEIKFRLKDEEMIQEMRDILENKQ